MYESDSIIYRFVSHGSYKNRNLVFCLLKKTHNPPKKMSKKTSSIKLLRQQLKKSERERENLDGPNFSTSTMRYTNYKFNKETN